jgi:glycosyl transferase, family 25
MIPAFFINLDRDANRRCFVEAQLSAAAIVAERFAGVDGSDLPALLARYFPLDSGLTPTQLGCSASHLSIMRVIVDRSIDAALVLEDDAVLPANLRSVVDEVLAALPAGWDIARLCRAPKRAFRPLCELPDASRLVRYSRIPLGTAGYLVSRSGARKLLKPRRIYRPNDVEIAHPWLLDLDVYGVVPPPIGQARGKLPSTIGASRGRGDISRLQRAIPDPRRVVFNIRKLGLAWWLKCWIANGLRWARPISASPVQRAAIRPRLWHGIR